MTAVLPVTTFPLATTSVVPLTVLQAVPVVRAGVLILVTFLLEVHVIFPPVAKELPGVTEALAYAVLSAAGTVQPETVTLPVAVPDTLVQTMLAGAFVVAPDGVAPPTTRREIGVATKANAATEVTIRRIKSPLSKVNERSLTIRIVNLWSRQVNQSSSTGVHFRYPSKFALLAYLLDLRRAVDR